MPHRRVVSAVASWPRFHSKPLHILILHCVYPEMSRTCPRIYPYGLKNLRYISPLNARFSGYTCANHDLISPKHSARPALHVQAKTATIYRTHARQTRFKPIYDSHVPVSPHTTASLQHASTPTRHHRTPRLGHPLCAVPLHRWNAVNRSYQCGGAVADS